ncbi:peroxiredoxin [Thermomonas fusca]|uniref:peroxiredoxin n=1 Tax=Thermomonas fusca TaxID=215690 RepID=UPI000422D678|nr:peroxiredoxin [Thermomonas fusca]MBH2009377.1 peroxiredoxin [Xanthomonadaceae bacterium]
MIDTGDRIPDLPLALSSDKPATLADYAGQWLVLYFYPKDSTPGCTTEGLDFNGLLPEFKRANAVVLGASKDSLKAHRNFCAKQGFRFDLISDPDGTLCEAFGVIQPKKLYGREYVGIVRSTFLIDPAGVVRQKWQPVKVPGHARGVLDALKAAQTT